MHIEFPLPPNPMEELEMRRKLAERKLSKKRSGTGQRKQVNKSKSMKWSPILHGIAAITGVIGLLSLFWLWGALLSGGELFNVTAEHIQDEVVVLFLASIAFGIATLIHQKQERE